MALDPERFYTSIPAKEQTTTRTFRGTTAMMNEIDRLCYNYDYPSYKTPGDFIRDAITHRLAQLKDQGADIDQSVLWAMKMQAKQVKFENAARIATIGHAYLRDTRESFREAIEAKDWIVLCHLRNNAATAITDFPPPWNTALFELMGEVDAQIPVEHHHRLTGYSHPSKKSILGVMGENETEDAFHPENYVGTTDGEAGWD